MVKHVECLHAFNVIMIGSYVKNAQLVLELIQLLEDVIGVVLLLVCNVLLIKLFVLHVIVLLVSIFPQEYVNIAQILNAITVPIINKIVSHVQHIMV